MAKTKHCPKCGKTKQASEFNKNSKLKSGLQTYCKSCVTTYTHKPEAVSKRNEYNKKYMKGDKDGIIYTITNPLGETYVGSTERLPNVRFNSHRSDYKTKGAHFPLLHKSFDTWGIDAHEFKVIENLGQVDTIDLREIESKMISAYKLNGKSLNIKN